MNIKSRGEALVWGKISRIIPVVLVFISCTSVTFGQKIADYGSVNAGDFTTLTTWEYSEIPELGWKAPTATEGYSGQLGVTNSVTIQAGNDVTISSSLTATESSIHSVSSSGAYYLRSRSPSHGKGKGSVAVSINSIPVIITQPADILDCEGHIVSFKVVATGSELIYVWQRKKPSEDAFINIPLIGESNVSYPAPGSIRLVNVGNSDAPDGTQYQVVITDSDNYSITSNSATLTVNEITGVTLPVNKIICQGEDYSYTVTTSYPSNVVSYQWKKYISPLIWDPVVDGGVISGANTSQLMFTGASPEESGRYKVTVVFSSSGADCNVTSDTRIRTLTVNPKPTISGILSIGTGSTSQLTGSGTAATSSPWISETPTVASIDNQGLVSGVAIGTSKIIYTDNNGCSVDALVSVSGTADIEVTKTAIASIAPGAWMTYTITITNHGLAAAPLITLTDNLPTVLSSPEYSIGSGDWNPWPITGKIDLFNLANTGIETILIKAQVDCSATGSISNTATVALTPITDPNPDNNSTSVSTPVSVSPLALTAVMTDVSCSGLDDGAINLTVTGGNPNSVAPFYTYNWTGPGTFNSSAEDLTGLIEGVYSVTVTDANDCIYSDNYVVGISPDTTPPIFTQNILAAGYCPEDIYEAKYNEDQSDSEWDLTFHRPDYYLFASGFTILNLLSYADNCAMAAIDPIIWVIDFGNDGIPDLTGTGQLSTYEPTAPMLGIEFPIGTNRITYTLTDATGNKSYPFYDLVVIPRPIMTKVP